MARPSSPTLTDSERRILEVLWKTKEASVREVTDALSKKKPVVMLKAGRTSMGARAAAVPTNCWLPRTICWRGGGGASWATG